MVRILMSGVLDDQTYIVVLGEFDISRRVVSARDFDRVVQDIALRAGLRHI